MRRLFAIRTVRMAAAALGILVLAAAILVAASPAHAALAKPAYDAGDRWVYTLQGSLGALPGFNASQGGSFRLGISGIVEVDINGATPSGVQAVTHASGFLNGTFAIPGNFTGNTSVTATGSFSSETSELWESQDYLPVASNGSTAYAIDVTVGVTVHFLLNLWVNATTSYASLPPFDLGTGDSASAPFTSQVAVASSFSAFGFGNHTENRTTVDGVWNRQVLGMDDVTVEAGTFPAYRLNESLGGFPGLTALPAAGANETAWFSNDAGNYVRRVAYVNGTPVAEMRLKSYTYPVAPPGPSVAEIALIAAVPIAAVAAVIILLLRRRKARREATKSSSGPGPVGELPPKNPGGKT